MCLSDQNDRHLYRYFERIDHSKRKQWATVAKEFGERLEGTHFNERKQFLSPAYMKSRQDGYIRVRKSLDVENLVRK